jgi:hypothetical protein
VSVRLTDAADARVPGVRCGVTLGLEGGEVRVEDSGDEPFEAVSRAIDRACRGPIQELR